MTFCRSIPFCYPVRDAGKVSRRMEYLELYKVRSFGIGGFSREVGQETGSCACELDTDNGDMLPYSQSQLCLHMPMVYCAQVLAFDFVTEAHAYVSIDLRN